MTPIFNQYLYKTTIPKLELKTVRGKLQARWANVNEGFAMPVDMILDNKTIRIYPKNDWTPTNLKMNKIDQIQVSGNKFYIIAP